MRRSGAAQGKTAVGVLTRTVRATSADPDTICSGCRRTMGADERFCAGCGRLREGLDPTKAIRAGEPSVETAWRQVQERLVAATAGRYEIVRELGRGGMAAVYLANEIRLKRQVAIKVMAPRCYSIRTWSSGSRAGRTVASLYHPIS
jgi:serine/threonine-protein kinase